MTIKEEFDGIVDELNKIDEFDFKGQLQLLKRYRKRFRESHDLRNLLYEEKSDTFRGVIAKIEFLALYFKGDEKAKGIDGKPCGIGLFYSELSDGKKKEFLEAANEWLRILDAKEVNNETKPI